MDVQQVKREDPVYKRGAASSRGQNCEGCKLDCSSDTNSSNSRRPKSVGERKQGTVHKIYRILGIEME